MDWGQVIVTVLGSSLLTGVISPFISKKINVDNDIRLNRKNLLDTAVRAIEDNPTWGFFKTSSYHALYPHLDQETQKQVNGFVATPDVKVQYESGEPIVRIIVGGEPQDVRYVKTVSIVIKNIENIRRKWRLI